MDTQNSGGGGGGWGSERPKFLKKSMKLAIPVKWEVQTKKNIRWGGIGEMGNIRAVFK